MTRKATDEERRLLSGMCTAPGCIQRRRRDGHFVGLCWDHFMERFFAEGSHVAERRKAIEAKRKLDAGEIKL